MSATDPTGEGGGGGGGGESAMMTNVDQNASPSTPITGTAVPMQAAVQQQQQQQQHPPPSPLSGCYLLVVLPEPHTAQHKDLILNRLAKGELPFFLRIKSVHVVQNRLPITNRLLTSKEQSRCSLAQHSVASVSEGLEATRGCKREDPFVEDSFLFLCTRTDTSFACGHGHIILRYVIS
ncbi:Microtubule-associated protein futsch [Ooceraea biroi]|uniref:Microtubule-associated protein futsch n=1 Tax=Ooceraea biroi TaxID=2015173 RepID=A0A026WE07_OOCBI|nr:Microtubule-associated protein futsch [Ooceraea biroi]